MNTLLEKTKVLLASTDIPVTTICRDLGLTTRWYYKFLNGQIQDPGVNRIQKLHDYLADKAA